MPSFLIRLNHKAHLLKRLMLLLLLLHLMF
nr:MAG TPA: hypothetical protein [Caudoviricetes sp.]